MIKKAEKIPGANIILLQLHGISGFMTVHPINIL